MTAGDFQEIYIEKDEWNCVVTCFFIDTAHNVIDYIEKIWHILKSGGKWINFGPLMYHYSDISYEKSIELSYEQIRSVIEKMGFKFLVNEIKIFYSLYYLIIFLKFINRKKKKTWNQNILIIEPQCLDINMIVSFLFVKNLDLFC